MRLALAFGSPEPRAESRLSAAARGDEAALAPRSVRRGEGPAQSGGAVGAAMLEPGWTGPGLFFFRKGRGERPWGEGRVGIRGATLPSSGTRSLSREPRAVASLRAKWGVPGGRERGPPSTPPTAPRCRAPAGGRPGRLQRRVAGQSARSRCPVGRARAATALDAGGRHVWAGLEGKRPPRKGQEHQANERARRSHRARGAGTLAWESIGPRDPGPSSRVPVWPGLGWGGEEPGNRALDLQGQLEGCCHSVGGRVGTLLSLCSILRIRCGARPPIVQGL